jgi:inosine-uridine nucleoside N-ribohydrolase
LVAHTWAAEARGVNGERADRPHKKILFDTDPGGDDAFALLWLQSLAKQGHAEIVAVTTVAGNVDGQHTFANACRILALGGFGEVEVGRSATTEPQAQDAAYIHGADGIGNLSRTLPEPRQRLSAARVAAEVIIEKLNAAPGEITLVAVGPLTNLAEAEAKCPGILAKAKEIVVMGGAFQHRGNVAPRAEFNIHCDPEAAAKVFASRDDVVVLPLDVTTRIGFTKTLAESICQAAPDHAIARLIVDLSRFLTKTTMGYRDTEGVAGFHVHDAATLAYLFYPETLLLRRGQVCVEIRGQWTRGQTVLDERHGAKPTANAWVARQVDATNLLAVLVEDFRLLCESQ